MLYGYKIVNSKAVVDKPAQKKVQQLFQNYLAGMSLSKAAEKGGIHIPHGMVGKLLSNQHYLGDSFYPQLIDKSTFEKVAVERRRRAEKLGRTKLKKPTVRKTVPTAFTLAKIEEYYDDPARQAEYLYSLIQENPE
mgnify:CR=1 FL=1